MFRQAGSGIWKYRDFFPPISNNCRLSLGEGGTSLVKIDDIFFKYEFENPTGSVKDRSFAYQISKIKELNIKEAVVSSSGNAAISAANYCRLGNIKLTIFVSPKINKKKLGKLNKFNCKIFKTEKPISSSIRFAKKNNAYLLRQSKDLYATFGYQTIAYELFEVNPNIDAIFIPVSSGTTLAGVASGYKRYGTIPSIHAVQTEAVNPIASLFDKSFTPKKKSLADALIAKFSQREKQIMEIIDKSKGWGWVISDDEIIIARKWLLSHKIDCSYEGASTLAAFWKAKKYGYIYKYPVCLLTGKFY